MGMSFYFFLDIDISFCQRRIENYRPGTAPRNERKSDQYLRVNDNTFVNTYNAHNTILKTNTKSRKYPCFSDQNFIEERFGERALTQRWTTCYSLRWSIGSRRTTVAGHWQPSLGIRFWPSIYIGKYILQTRRTYICEIFLTNMDCQRCEYFLTKVLLSWCSLLLSLFIIMIIVVVVITFDVDSQGFGGFRREPEAMSNEGQDSDPRLRMVIMMSPGSCLYNDDGKDVDNF